MKTTQLYTACTEYLYDKENCAAIILNGGDHILDI